jgi:hypothetical protein
MVLRMHALPRVAKAVAGRLLRVLLLRLKGLSANSGRRPERVLRVVGETRNNSADGARFKTLALDRTKVLGNHAHVVSCGRLQAAAFQTLTDPAGRLFTYQYTGSIDAQRLSAVVYPGRARTHRRANTFTTRVRTRAGSTCPMR